MKSRHLVRHSIDILCLLITGWAQWRSPFAVARTLSRGALFFKMMGKRGAPWHGLLSLNPAQWSFCRSIVQTVHPGQPADVAGIQVGDCIVGIGGSRLHCPPFRNASTAHRISTTFEGRFSINPGMLAKAMQLIKEAKGMDSLDPLLRSHDHCVR